MLETVTMAGPLAELVPDTSQKSFHHRAYVDWDEMGNSYLFSYGTLVMVANNQNHGFYRVWDGYSATTAKHVKAFVASIDIPNRWYARYRGKDGNLHAARGSEIASKAIFTSIPCVDHRIECVDGSVFFANRANVERYLNAFDVYDVRKLPFYRKELRERCEKSLAPQYL